MDSGEYIISRLRQVLRRHQEKSSWRQISKEIRRASGANDVTIDRRTLAQICSDDWRKVSLSLAQLSALDTYFAYSNEGPLFVRTRGLVDAIAESSEVAFYLAGKYHRELDTEAVSGYDLRAIAALLGTRLNRLSPKIFDVTGPKDWRAAKKGVDTIACVAIGSPIASYASDRFMCSMLGLDVKKETATDRLPFFIVRRRKERLLTSGFLRTRLHAIRRNPTAADRISVDQRALVFEDKVFIGDDKTDYSLLLAQRNPDSGHVRAVLAGLSGHGTLELARLLAAGEPMKDLPALRKGEKHPVIVAAVYKHTLQGRRSRAKGRVPDTRTVAGSTTVVAPLLLHHNDGAWRSFSGAS